MAREGDETERRAAREVATGLRALLVDRAETRDGIECDASAVAALIEAAHAAVLDDEFLRHAVPGAQFHDEMTAAAAARAGGHGW